MDMTLTLAVEGERGARREGAGAQEECKYISIIPACSVYSQGDAYAGSSIKICYSFYKESLGILSNP